ncbi:hypothetical protein [Subtercola endophyticus]|uniref:hypothetical protein n=1 Tax=Subtercola endophyticus TaxID=2895559 RepID=UPI001E3A6261|nr:hypothetical protein [Subtercola endophyticus]UFS58790.1 hypothetical protein LQ955_17615 [Subtercola endophyticus]
MTANDLLLLRNISVRPGHEEQFGESWGQDAASHVADGAELLDAYLETGTGLVYNLNENRASDTGARRIHTSLWRVADPAAAAITLSTLSERLAPHASGVEVTAVVAEHLPTADDETLSKMTIMRRYSIQGDWNEFLEVWREVAAVREKYRFALLFAVADRLSNVFTWAFTTEQNDFSSFMSEGQKDYYGDPQRVRLESINAYMKEIALTPAKRLSTAELGG